MRQSNRSAKRVLTEDEGGDWDTRTEVMRCERERTWKSPEMRRNRYVAVSHASFRKSQDFQTWFEKQRVAYQFTGKAGASHRAFISSAGTTELEGREPWKPTTVSKHVDAVS